MPEQNEERKEKKSWFKKFNYHLKLPKTKGMFRGTLKALVLMGILMILQNEGAFESYPAVNDFVTAILSIMNWCYAVIMHIINWVSSWEIVKWLAELPL